tara:strand:- start:412 stop:789 length:378 start_codon:yes stop_codon:yes gene_type:complete
MNASVPKKMEHQSNQILENEFDDIPFPDLQVAHRPMIGPSKEPVKRAGRFPIDPLALPGTIGDTVRWIVRSSIRPQPEIALMNTLAVSAPSLRIYIDLTELCYEDLGGVVPIQHLKFPMKFITAR